MDTRSQTARATKYDTLKNMNANSGRHAAWLLCIRSPKIRVIKFKSKGEPVEGFQFQCLLVSNDAKQYMYGRVPFDFKNRGAAEQAMQKFIENSVWKITNPTFDDKAKVQYISCPIKTVLLLKEPTKMEELKNPGDCKETKKWWPTGEVHVPMSLTGIIDALKKVKLWSCMFCHARSCSFACFLCRKCQCDEDGIQLCMLRIRCDSLSSLTRAVGTAPHYAHNLFGARASTRWTIMSKTHCCRVCRDNTGQEKSNFM